MWLATFAQVLTLAVTTNGPGVAPPALPEAIFTRQTFFSIPFSIPHTGETPARPTEVQLFVSSDQGAHWGHYTSVSPGQSQFLFRASSDGEYWFVVRTLDQSGNIRPRQVDGPGLRVVVDTTPPTVDLKAWQGAAGQITSGWRVLEPNLDLDRLTIQYRTDATQAWQAVAVDRRGIRREGDTVTGQVTWWPPSGASQSVIRMEAWDTAGNRSVSHAQMNVSAKAAPPSGFEPAPQPAPGKDLQRPTAGSQTDRTAMRPDVGWRASHDAAPAANNQQSRPLAPNREQSERVAASPPRHPRAAPDRADSAPGQNRPPADQSLGRDPSTAPESSVVAQPNPPLQRRYAPSESRESTPAGPAGPPTPRPQMVNSRLFELDYAVEAAGRSEIERVELWGTRDGGRTWARFGSDNDTLSPMLVTVDDEGLYGFRVVVENRLGSSGRKPQSGDAPDAWVGVDLTAPSARIIAAEPSVGNGKGQLTIRWDARDTQLASGPISLYYSDTPRVGWVPIARGLENTGEHKWDADNRVPTRVFLRLEARDEAGNVGAFETEQPVLLDRRGPAVEVRGVRPVGQSARTPPTRHTIFR